MENKDQKGWEDKFTQEFGIHFKGSTGELQFAIDFIRQVEQEAYERGYKIGLADGTE